MMEIIHAHTIFCGDYPYMHYLLCSMTHYDITMDNYVARDAYYNITMGNDVPRDIHCDITMCNDVAMYISQSMTLL